MRRHPYCEIKNLAFDIVLFVFLKFLPRSFFLLSLPQMRTRTVWQKLKRHLEISTGPSLASLADIRNQQPINFSINHLRVQQRFLYGSSVATWLKSMQARPIIIFIHGKLIRQQEGKWCSNSTTRDSYVNFSFEVPGSVFHVHWICILTLVAYWPCLFRPVTAP